MAASLAKVFFCDQVLHHSDQHADARGGETKAPIYLFSYPTHDQRRKRSQVDAHVKDRKARIPAIVVAAVKLSDDGADIWLQQTGSENQQCQAAIEGGHARRSQAEISGGNQDASEQHRTLLPDNAVRDPSSWQAEQINHCRVKAINRTRFHDRETEAAGLQSGSHIKDEK